MMTGEIIFQIWAQDNNTFWMMYEILSKMLVKKSKFVLRKKTHLSTNIPLLSYRKSEQQVGCKVSRLYK